MKLDRTAPSGIVVLLIASALLLSGCSSAATDDTGPSTDGATEESADTDAVAPTEPWAECPAIVERLNANEDDPTRYEQIDAADFAVPEVGDDVLAGACVISVTVNEDPITWALVPGNAALAASVETTLKGAGFVDGGSSLLGDPTTNRGVLVKAFGTGADLDAFLGNTAFTSIAEPIVYLGTFGLS